MKSPFIFGKIAAGEHFTDREEETASLTRDFINLTNTVILSPRRWGKSSLVRKAGAQAMEADPGLRMCYLDIFNVRDENEFYEKLAAEVVRSTSTKWEEMLSTALRFASALVPAISAGDPVNTVKVEFKVQDFRQNADDILDMAERIAVSKKLRIVVCIDEFQQIAAFGNPDAFQAKLRSHWQLHQHVSYCLYGSRRHMLMDVFTNREKPFFQFGKVIFLEKIPRELWPPFIRNKFLLTGKSISEGQCFRIVDAVDNSPYYIQQLCEEVWNRTSGACEDESLDEAFQAVVRSQSLLNQSITSMLTVSQQNLLHAIVDGHRNLSSAAVMERYGLKNSLTVLRAKKALAALDIIDTFGPGVTLEDPVYGWWLKNVYFA